MMALGVEVGLGPGHIVLDGDPSPPPPNVRPMSIVAKRLDVSRCHLVRRWASAQTTLCCVGIQLPTPSPKRGCNPQFSAHVYCGQTAEWIKMPFGAEVGIGPGDIVLDGELVPPKRCTAPSLRPISIVAKRLDI